MSGRHTHQRNAYKPNRYTRQASGEALLADKGISVFRNPIGMSLDSTISAFQIATQGLIISPRNVGDQKEHSVSVVQLSEILRNKHLFGEVRVREASDAIYERVPSTHRRIRLDPSSVEFFGSRHNPVRSLSVTFTPDTEAQLTEERFAVIDTLMELSGIESDGVSWPNHRPHLSLGKVVIDGLNLAAKDNLLSLVGSSLPSSVKLDRAILLGQP